MKKSRNFIKIHIRFDPSQKIWKKLWIGLFYSITPINCILTESKPKLPISKIVIVLRKKIMGMLSGRMTFPSRKYYNFGKVLFGINYIKIQFYNSNPYNIIKE